MTLAEGVIREDALVVGERGAELAVHLPWHSSLPLACLEDIRVTIDGRDALDADPVIRTFGREFHGHLTEAATCAVSWDLRDAVFVELALVPSPGPHEVTVEVSCRIPYILIRPGTPLVMRTCAARSICG